VKLELIAITDKGELIKPVPSMPSLAAEVVEATTQLYRTVGYELPWIGYLASENGICVGAWFLAQKHGYREGATPSDALLEDLALHFSLTVYHLTCTCRIGSVVDPRLRVMGVGKLRVADASVMPNVVSGNTNAASIMIGEKAAEMVAADHGVKLAEFVGEHPARRL
jgi:choline dehydrogenase-like flavoprotein